MQNVKYVLLILMSLLESHSIKSQTPCENGMAGEYPCQNIELLGHLSTDDLLAEEHEGVLLNDIWGWTDTDTNREYAIVGMANGTSFVDITDPSNPLMLGILPEHHEAEQAGSGARVFHNGAKSVWRDIKVYANHAFIVSEDAGHGMQVFDLTQLREVEDPPVEFPESANYQGISNAHNIVINEETGFAYAVGATLEAECSGGGLHIINIQDPKNPSFEACYSGDSYTHDSQCVVYQGSDGDYLGKELCFSLNEDDFSIVDVSEKTAIQQVSKSFYEGNAYAHQGWLTEDHKFFLANDELDELNGITDQTKTFIWDVQNLEEPLFLGFYEHNTSSIDHNLYITQNKVYESNYTSGLRVLDLENIAIGELREMAYFDTYPANGEISFFGSWSNYPFFESGVIAVSDITNGLFLLKENYKNAYVVKQPENIEACVGAHLNMGIEAGGEKVDYQWQLNRGDGFEDITDFARYKNTNLDSLHLHEVTFDQNGHEYRCVLSTEDGNETISEVAKLILADSVIADFSYILEDNLVEFTNTSYAGESYQWDFGDGAALNSSASPSHQFTGAPGEDYTVKLVASNTCSKDTIEMTLMLVLDSFDAISDDVLIYPNPATSVFNLDLGDSSGNTSMIIYATTGQIMKQKEINFERQVEIEVTDLISGIYFLELRSRHFGTKNFKLMIE